MLSKVDTNNVVKWNKFYGDTNYYYNPFALSATNDSGVVVCGMRYNIASPTYTNVGEGFVMKVDKNGNQSTLTAIENNLFSELFTTKCYPNPSQNEVHFDIGTNSEASVSIYNTNGAEVMFIGKYKNREIVKIESFSKGFYYYNIKCGTTTYSGKIYKN